MRASIAITLLLAPVLSHAAPPIHSARATAHPVSGTGGAVATQEAIATRTAADVLAAGGNAIDAAVTAGFTLAVTHPAAGNIGGGGFMLVHLADTDTTHAVDYREKAPGAASRDMFLDPDGNPDPVRSRQSHLAVGVPGTVRGLALALEKYGTLTLSQTLAPAIELAGHGFPVSTTLAASLASYASDFKKSPPAAAIFLKPDGSPYQTGDTLVQSDLARTLRLIADHGPDAFYRGPIASAIAADMKTNGGLITTADLANYQPALRQPVTGTYRGHTITSMPPPSSGGVHLVQMLNILEHFPLGDYGHNSASAIHTAAGAMKFAYADRSRYLGDPDFVDVPVGHLTDKNYAATLAKKIAPDKTTPSPQIAPGLGPAPAESDQTTHFSVIDKWGNAVANTYTLNFSYGSRIVAAGTGILLNNEMDDFSAKPGTPNGFGLLGGSANAVAPNKRMLSSMTPTLVKFPDGSLLATGTPGGSRIITTICISTSQYY